MAIAFDAFSKGTETTATSLTWNHTLAGNLIVVGVRNSTGTSVSGITWNTSENFTEIQTVTSTAKVGLWYLFTNTTGTKAITINLSGSSFVQGSAESYSGVKQSGQPEVSNTGAGSIGTGASLTISVTTTSDNDWLVGAFQAFSDDIIAGTGTTFHTSNLSIGDSNAAKSPAGSYSLAAKAVGATVICGVVAAFAPSVAVISPPDLRLAFI